MATHSSILAWKILWAKEPAWWAIVLEVAKRRIRLSTYTYICISCLIFCSQDSGMSMTQRIREYVLLFFFFFFFHRIGHKYLFHEEDLKLKNRICCSVWKHTRCTVCTRNLHSLLPERLNPTSENCWKPL